MKIIDNQTLTEQWQKQGFIGPFRLSTFENWEKTRNDIYSRIIFSQAPKQLQTDPYYCRHLDDELVSTLCSQPEIIEIVSTIFVAETVLWMSEFIYKNPGAKEIKFHQDVGTMLEPPLSITVWIAIDNVTIENGCLRLIPSAANQILPHLESDQGQIIDLSHSGFSVNDAVDIPMKQGEFLIFKHSTVHGSRPNLSNAPRLGFTFRLAPHLVTIKTDGRYFEGYRPVKMSK